MVLLDRLTAFLRGTRSPTSSPSHAPGEEPERQLVAPTPAEANSVAYPLRKPSVDPLPALISRALGPLDRGQRPSAAGMKTWDSIQDELRQIFADHFTQLEPYLAGELAHTHPEQVAQIPAHSQ